MRIRKSFVIAGISAVFVIFIAALVIIANFDSLRHKTQVAFYGLNEVQVKAFEAELASVTDKNGKIVHYAFTVLDDSVPLAEQLSSRTDLLVSAAGASLDEAVASVPAKKMDSYALEQTVLSGMYSSVAAFSMRNDKGRVLSLPLLVDPVEILLNAQTLSQTGMRKISSINMLGDYASKSRGTVYFPVVFAGADARSFVDMTGALAESLSGSGAFDEAVKLVRSEKSRSAEDLVKDLCAGENAPFNKAATLLSEWTRGRIIMNDVYNLEDKGLPALMRENMCAAVFTDLSSHRQFEFEALRHFVSVPDASGETLPFVPSERPLITRRLTAGVICAVPLSKEKGTGYAVDRLVSSGAQESLSRATGLGPVLADSAVPDRQADDARFWIAASDVPFVPFSRAAFTDGEFLDAFATALKIYIRNGQF